MKKILSTLFLALLAAIIFLPADKANAITSYASAVPIEVNQEYTGTIPSNNSSEDHFYKFSIPSDGNVELTIKNLTGAQWSGKIVDSQGIQIDSIITDNGTFANGYNKTFTGLPAGTYYVVIESYYYGSGKQYAFSVDYVAGDYFEKEKNNTLTTANPIKLNNNYQAALSESNDKDFYKFTLTEPGNIILSLKNVPHVTWSAAIYNSEEKRYTYLQTNDSELVTGNSSVNVGLPAGTYYILVENYSYATDVVYNMNVTYTQSDLYEKEFNDTIATATPFTLNNSYKGALQFSNDLDFYKFTLASDSNVKISISALENKSWYLYLQDANGQTVDYFNTRYDGVISKSAYIEVGLPKGTYYVRISNYTNTTNQPYTLTINAKASKIYEKEHNDTFTTATTLPLNTAMNGTIGNKPSNDQDYYKLVVPTSGNVKLSLTQKSGVAWNYNLMNDSGNSILYGSTNYNELVKGDWSSTVYLTKGTYYIRISNYTNTLWQPYTLKVSQTTVTPAANNVVIKNNKGKADTITVKGVKKGSTIKVYNSKSVQIASVKATGTTATLTVKQLGTQAGKVYVTVQEPGKVVSARRTVNFARER